MDGLIVDNFAGGGGASLGIFLATGRHPDIAINHDRAAVEMHAANHPGTLHLCEDVWSVDPVQACKGRPVSLAWFSPDCKHFSRAKGGKPVEKRIRGLAWVAVKWARAVAPEIIVIENVREFQDWGPLIPKLDERGRGEKDGDGSPVLVPDPTRRGQSFRRFVGHLRGLGYAVEWRDLDAANFGAPTHRQRLFLIARRDGEPIAWPAPTHGTLLLPYRAAAECIDWSLPCPSIFLSREEGRKLGVNRPLAENTMRRIARGIKRYVLDAAEPFIVQPARGTQNQIVAATMVHLNHGEKQWSDLREPMRTITAGGNHAAEVRAFLIKYYGMGTGQVLGDPLHTVTVNDRFGLVTIHGQLWRIVDIGMRMLTPRELARAQGFPDSYILTGTKTSQVARIGNSVCPPMAAAIVRANVSRGAKSHVA